MNVHESSVALERVFSDVRSRTTQPVEDESLEVLLIQLSTLKTFLSDCSLEKHRYVAIRVLDEHKKCSTTNKELLSLVILYKPCASCSECTTVVCNSSKEDHLFHILYYNNNKNSRIYSKIKCKEELWSSWKRALLCFKPLFLDMFFYSYCRKVTTCLGQSSTISEGCFHDRSIGTNAKCHICCQLRL